MLVAAPCHAILLEHERSCDTKFAWRYFIESARASDAKLYRRGILQPDCRIDQPGRPRLVL